MNKKNKGSFYDRKDMTKPPNWGEVPALVLTEIFSYLNYNDRLKASATCWNWRSTIFQPRFFKRVNFDICPENDFRNDFFLASLAHLVSETSISFDSNNLHGIKRATEIIKKLSTSACLTSLHLKPKRPRLLVPPNYYYKEFIHKFLLEPLKTLISRSQPPFRVLNLGGCEQLTLHAHEFLKLAAKPQDFKQLGLASIKQFPSRYILSELEPNMFEKCTSLHTLSLDYDVMNDEFLHALQILPLKKLIIHVHGLDQEHPGITENAWASFKAKNPDAELHLTLIYAYEAVIVLQSHIFRPSMPLSHLKVLFSNFINTEALEYLSQYFKETLKSVIWVDSVFERFRQNTVDLYLNVQSEQDPLIMMAWRCKKLQEIVMHGYLLDPHNLVGISRLRGRDLKKLEVSWYDLSHTQLMSSFIEEISIQLGQNWSPLFGEYGSNDIRDKYIMEMVQNGIE